MFSAGCTVSVSFGYGFGAYCDERYFPTAAHLKDAHLVCRHLRLSKIRVQTRVMLHITVNVFRVFESSFRSFIMAITFVNMLSICMFLSCTLYAILSITIFPVFARNKKPPGGAPGGSFRIPLKIQEELLDIIQRSAARGRMVETLLERDHMLGDLKVGSVSHKRNEGVPILLDQIWANFSADDDV